MKSEDLTAWMLAEHEKIHKLCDQLREKVTAPPRGDRAKWIADLGNFLDDFAPRISEHTEREEQGGYLAQVVELRPTLSEAVELIRNEHEELISILASIRAAVHELAPTSNLLLRDCCKRIQHFLMWLERHEEHENHIVMYAFTQDIGTPD